MITSINTGYYEQSIAFIQVSSNEGGLRAFYTRVYFFDDDITMRHPVYNATIDIFLNQAFKNTVSETLNKIYNNKLTNR